MNTTEFQDNQDAINILQEARMRVLEDNPVMSNKVWDFLYHAGAHLNKRNQFLLKDTLKGPSVWQRLLGTK